MKKYNILKKTFKKYFTISFLLSLLFLIPIIHYDTDVLIMLSFMFILQSFTIGITAVIIKEHYFL